MNHYKKKFHLTFISHFISHNLKNEDQRNNDIQKRGIQRIISYVGKYGNKLIKGCMKI